MAHKVIDVRQLGNALRELQASVPKAVERGLRDGALMLRGPLVQIEIAKANPQPFDQGQYKASWGSRDVDGGAIVFNLAKHAAFVERGRRPGRMPPMSPIREWVRRKGLWKKRYSELLSESRSESPSAILAKKSPGRRSLGVTGKRGSAKANRAKLKDQAIDEVAWLVRRRIGAFGTKGSGILWLALRRLQPKLPGIIKRSILELQP